MALTINTNIMALNTQNQLSKSSAQLQTSMERLSSGLRINSAKDDAAGLAIADRFNTQIRGLNQAVRNANDGISLAQTAEGAMGEMSNILQRMRELAVQAINDTNTASDRLAIQNEVDQLYSELDRIATSTQFNGQNVLDGTLRSSTFQIGANAGQTLNVALESVTTQKLGLNGFTALGELNSGRTAGPDTQTLDVTFNSAATNTNEYLVFDLNQDGDGADTSEGDLSFQINGTGTPLTLTEIVDTINNNQSFSDLGISAEAVGTDGLRIINNGSSEFDVMTATNSTTLARDDATLLTDIGTTAFTASGAATLASSDVVLASNDILINGESAFASDVTLASRTDFATGSGGDSAKTLADAINNNSGVSGVSAESYNTLTTTALSDGITFSASINGTNVTATSAEDLVDVINRDVSGLTATLNVDNSVTLSNETGRDIIIGDYDNDGDTLYSGGNSDDDTASNIGLTNGTYTGFLALTSADGSEISVAANADGSGAISDVQALGFNSSAGSDTVSGSAVTSAAITDADDIEINGIAVGASDGGSAADKAAAVNAIKSETNVEASAFTSLTIGVSFANNVADDTITINGTEIELDATPGTGGTAYSELDQVVAAINNAGIGGVSAKADDDGNLILSSSTGLDINVEGDSDIFTSFVDQSGTSLTTTTTQTTYTLTAILNYTQDAANATVLDVDGTEVTIAANTTVDGAVTAINNANIAGVTATKTDSGQIEIVETSTSAAPTLSVAAGESVGDAFNLVTPTTTNVVVDAGGTAANDFIAFDLAGDGAGAGDIAIQANTSVGVLTATQIATNINSNADLVAAGISAADVDGVLVITNNNSTGIGIYAASDAAATPTVASTQDVLSIGGANLASSLVSLGTASYATVTPVAGSVDTVEANARGVITLAGINGEDVRVAGADVDKLGLVEQGGSTDVIGAGLSVATAGNAEVALGRIDDALTVINEARSALGAVQNRFESTISNLSNVSQNLTAARGRIIDADFAVETMNLSKAQVLQQAGTAMLAQANASQQSVLSLLG